MTVIGEVDSFPKTQWIEWKIKDFSLLEIEDKPCSSPLFSLHGESWNLVTYLNVPRSSDSFEYNNSLCLIRNSGGSPINVEISVALKSMNGEKHMERHFTKAFDPDTSSVLVIPQFISTPELVKRSSELVPSGSLTFICSMTILPTTENEIARKKAKRAENVSKLHTTDVEDDLVRLKRKMNSKKIPVTESIDEKRASLQANNLQNSLPVFNAKSTSQNSAYISRIEEAGFHRTSANNTEINVEYDSSESQFTPVSVANSATSDASAQIHSAGFEVVARHLVQLEGLMAEFIDNEQIIQNHLMPLDASNIDLDIPGLNLPCESVQDVNILENWLQSTNNEQFLEKCLALRGGRNLRQVVYKILERIFSNDLAVKYNYTGKGGKESLKSLSKIIAVIQRSVRKNNVSSESTEMDIITNVVNWFRFAKDRDGGRERRRQSKGSSQS